MKYLIVCNVAPDMTPKLIYDSANTLEEAKKRCERLAIETPGTTFSFYDWAGGYQSSVRVETERLWDNPWKPSVDPEPVPELDSQGIPS